MNTLMVLESEELLAKKKESWYRLEDREHTATKPTLKIGDKVCFTRSIERVGYYIQPKEMDEAECERIARKALLRHINERAVWGKSWDSFNNQVRIYLTAAKQYVPPEDAIVKQETFDLFLNSLGLTDALRHIKYLVRAEWLRENRLKIGKHPLDIRTFWYVDHPKRTGFVNGIRRHVLGEWFPGGGDSDDYEPAALEQWCQQSVYVIYPDDHSSIYVIHPLDAQ